jgi:hypothetical protein
VLSQYLTRQSDRDSAALRGDLQTQVARISATAERLERVTASDHGSISHADDDRRGAEGVTVTTTVGPCRPGAAAAADVAAPVCSEQEALRVTLCGSVPLSAVVTATVLYARPENSQQPWAESRVAPGQDVGRARFADKTFERNESEQTKQVCTSFSAWDGELAYSARLVVTYGTAPAAPATPAAREVSNAVVAPSSGAGN